MYQKITQKSAMNKHRKRINIAIWLITVDSDIRKKVQIGVDVKYIMELYQL